MRDPWGTYDPIPGWNDWQLFIACVFPFLDMQDEIDQLELGEQAWMYLEKTWKTSRT